jgi:hypothetical protein
MKLTKILLWTTYLILVGSIVASGIFGFFFVKNGFDAQNFEKGSLEGVVSKKTTGAFKLPMNLEVNYFLRIEDGQVLVDNYFFKIQKKSLPDSFLAKLVIPKTDYPVPIEGIFYSMPESDSYLYIKTDFSTIESSLNIWKIYFLLTFVSLVGGIAIVILFLQNCDKGNFFIPQNAAYLRAISYLAIVFGLLDYGAQWLIYQKMNSQIEDTFSFSLNSDLEFDWKYLIFSLFLVIIAQAFTEGTKLKEEQSLTI